MPSHDMVRVVYTKYDGSAHRDYPARRFDSDELGVWVGVTRGTPSVYHGRPSVEQIPFVLLVPHRAWWTGMFNPPPRTSEVYCDITTPACWEGDTVRIVDLDLDVVRRRAEPRWASRCRAARSPISRRGPPSSALGGLGRWPPCGGPGWVECQFRV